MHPFSARLLASALVALLTAGGARFAAPLHDTLGGLVPAPRLPVAVVRFEGEVEAAAAAARAAGAGTVWVALPAGDPRVGSARPDPGTLRPGKDGRIRFDGDLRLPLPEALGGLMELDANQLGPGTPAGALGGRPVVLAWSDPAMGIRDAAPGSTAPVDRARILAVAIGARAEDAGLQVVPFGLAVAMVAACSLLAGQMFARRLPRRTFADMAIASAVALVVALVARAFGWDLPVGGLVLAAPLAGVVRLAHAVDDTFRTFDRTLAWLGSPPADSPVPTGLAALAEIVSVYAPGATVVAWGRGALVVAEVPGTGKVPTLAELPVRAASGPGWHVEPVLDRGDVVGAIGVGRIDGVPPDLAALLGVLARNKELAPPLPNAGGADPHTARLDLVRTAVRRALSRAERWEELLARSGGAVGVFDLRGGLVTGGDAIRRHLGDGTRPPLLAAVARLSALDVFAARPVVRAALGGDGPVRLPGRTPNEEVVLTPLGSGEDRVGVLLQVHDIAAHRREVRLGVGLLAATVASARRTLGTLGDQLQALWHEDDAATRGRLLRQAAESVAGLERALERGERLAGGRSAEELEPVVVPTLVSEVVGALATRDRVTVSVDGGDAPVAAQSDALSRALVAVLEEITHVGRARITTRAGVGELTLVVEDDAGGLPSGVVARLLADGTRGLGAARRQMEAMGGGLRAVAEPGGPTRIEMWLGYF